MICENLLFEFYFVSSFFSSPFSFSVSFCLSSFILFTSVFLFLAGVSKPAVGQNIALCSAPPKGGRGFLMSPPCLDLRAASLIPLFYISSFVLLPSPVALSVLSFSTFGTFS